MPGLLWNELQGVCWYSSQRFVSGGIGLCDLEFMLTRCQILLEDRYTIRRCNDSLSDVSSGSQLLQAWILMISCIGGTKSSATRLCLHRDASSSAQGSRDERERGGRYTCCTIPSVHASWSGLGASSMLLHIHPIDQLKIGPASIKYMYSYTAFLLSFTGSSVEKPYKPSTEASNLNEVVPAGRHQNHTAVADQATTV